MKANEAASGNNAARKRIWVDLDNSPHVPLFRPIIDRLREIGYDVFITARDAYQVRELIAFYGMTARVVGKHYGKHKILKTLGTFWRAFALMRLMRQQRPDLALCHGSRGLLLTCTIMRIPAVALMDYEFGAELPFVKPKWLMVPSVLSEHHMGFTGESITYPGIKEDVYLPTFKPDPTLRSRLGVAAETVLILVRPPATEAHYHNPDGDKLLVDVLDHFSSSDATKILLLPRNKKQERDLRSVWARRIASGHIVIPDHAEDGLNLIWNSDLVISGGGTMNREAAAMGVPVYSIFRGKLGAVDRYLSDQGRLTLVRNSDDARTQIKAVRRERRGLPGTRPKNPALETIIANIVSMVEFNAVAARPRSAAASQLSEQAPSSVERKAS